MFSPGNGRAHGPRDPWNLPPGRPPQASGEPMSFPPALRKRAPDLIVALLLLLLSAPLLLLAAVLIKVTSRGPALVPQVHLGPRGRRFVTYKLRTEVPCVGRFLRRTRLDGLLQLWNVLRGDMSLVGPRSERPEFVALVERIVPPYRRRLLVAPGVTGLTQLLLPADTDVASIRRRLAYELYYLRKWSLGLDLRLLSAALVRSFGVPLSVIAPLFGLPRGRPAGRPPRPRRRGASQVRDRSVPDSGADRFRVPPAILARCRGWPR
jgi:lipopolysaccharide/colanic/teichoic acid biosynthesis glycosyltransferase